MPLRPPEHLIFLVSLVLFKVELMQYATPSQSVLTSLDALSPKKKEAVVALVLFKGCACRSSEESLISNLQLPPQKRKGFVSIIPGPVSVTISLYG